MLKPRELLPDKPIGGIYHDYLSSTHYEAIRTHKDILFLAFSELGKEIEKDALRREALYDNNPVKKYDQETLVTVIDNFISMIGVPEHGYLLLDLLTLYEQVDDRCSWEFNNLKNSTFIINEIIKLCKTHTLLYREKGFKLPSTIETNCSMPYFGFCLSDFVQELQDLYRLYLCWLIAVRGMDTCETIQKYSNLFLRKFPSSYLEYAKQSGSFSGALSSYESGMATNTVRPKFILYQEMNGGFSLRTFAGSPIQAAKWEMLKLFTIDIEQLGSISICKQCGREFIKTHANRSLCDECRTNASKLRAHRARVKSKKSGEKDV